jgi:hypothetical protein
VQAFPGSKGHVDTKANEVRLAQLEQSAETALEVLKARLVLKAQEASRASLVLRATRAERVLVEMRAWRVSAVSLVQLAPPAILVLLACLAPLATKARLETWVPKDLVVRSHTLESTPTMG